MADSDMPRGHTLHVLVGVWRTHYLSYRMLGLLSSNKLKYCFCFAFSFFILEDCESGDGDLGLLLGLLFKIIALQGEFTKRNCTALNSLFHSKMRKGTGGSKRDPKL